MEIPDDIQQLKQLVAELLERLSQLEAENAELRRRLGLTSQNSHKPPAADGLSKKSLLPKENGKKNGGQVGHAGKTLERVENADEIMLHHAAACHLCQRRLTLADVTRIIARRQVFDLPEPRLCVVEHQVAEILGCGETYRGEFPALVTKAVQYGSRIKALRVRLNNEYGLGLEKIERLFMDLTARPLNQSTILSANEEGFEKLLPIEGQIREALLASEVAHFDETGMRIAGRLNWLHTASNQWWRYLFTHEKRGSAALVSESSVIKDFQNWAVHDCWGSYFRFAQCRHILCNAHLLRELEGLKEQGSQWAFRMQEVIYQLYEASQRGSKVLQGREEWESRYRQICEAAEIEEPPPKAGQRGRAKNSVGRNLLNRMKKHRDAILEYAFREEVPFTNNQAERDIRCVKIKQKMSNSFRTKAGAANYARIQGFVSTLRKQGMNVFEEIVNVFNDKAISFPMAK